MNESESYTAELRETILDTLDLAGNAKRTTVEQAEKIGEMVDFILDNEALTADELKDIYNKFADLTKSYHLEGVSKEDDSELSYLSDVNESYNRYYSDGTCYVAYPYGDGSERWVEAETTYESYNESMGEDIDIQRIKLVGEKFAR